MRAKITKRMLEKLTKLVPKLSQNLSKIDPGGALEASWEPPLKQGASKTSFLTILAPFWDPHLGPVWAHFGHHIFDVFLKWLFDGLGLHLGSQKTPPTWDPRGGQNQKLKFIKFASIYCTLATFRGAENDNLLLFFWNPVLRGLWEPILMILDHFWCPFWRPFWSLVGYNFCIDFWTP